MIQDNDIEKRIKNVLLTAKFDVQEQIFGGEIGCRIYRGRYDDNNAVIKIGFDQKTVTEVDSNMKAYTQSKSLSDTTLNPTIYRSNLPTSIKNNNDITAYMVMEDLGDNAKDSITKKTQSYEQITQALIDRLGPIYESSIQKNPELAQEWIKNIIDCGLKYCELNESLGLISNKYKQLKDLDISSIAPQMVTFATGDLTPDNVFLKDGNIRCIDYKGIVPDSKSLGVNIVDLLMWDCLSKDVYELPQAKAFSEKCMMPFIRSQLKTAESKQPEKLVLLGQIRQYSLSTYYGNKKGRANTPEVAKKLERAIEEIL